MFTASRGAGSVRLVSQSQRIQLNRLRDDVLAVIDKLELKKPVLVGHSFAGAEMSAVANSYPIESPGWFTLKLRIHTHSTTVRVQA
jgi:pimeloyl-ACP methyl ester carboxylesterase